MTSDQIRYIVTNRAFSHVSNEVTLVETHASWVLLTDQYAYKVKKPVNFGFLDFSKLANRKHCCNLEVILNQRLTKNMYLDVVPITQSEDHILLGGKEGNVIGYAVKMRRMDEKRQMNILLEQGLVSAQHILQIADTLSAFHLSVRTQDHAPIISELVEDFNDIQNVIPLAANYVNDSAKATIVQAIAFSNSFLNEHANRIQERHLQGYTIDGHGDLHSRNIFLLHEPVIFDCIEFNPHFRHMDVLNELAFFGMDLNYYNRVDLESKFLEHYLMTFPCMSLKTDRLLYQYFKLYRANVRAKVELLKVDQMGKDRDLQSQLYVIQRYITLMDEYLRHLTTT